MKLNAQIEVGKTHLMSIERFVPLNSIKSSLFVFNSQLAQLIRTLTRSPHILQQYQIRFHQQTKWKIHSERASNERNEKKRKKRKKHAKCSDKKCRKFSEAQCSQVDSLQNVHNLREMTVKTFHLF